MTNEPKWVSEEMHTESPPLNIMCATCKYSEGDVTVHGITFRGCVKAMCQKYDIKPHAVLWNGAYCKEYKDAERNIR